MNDNLAIRTLVGLVMSVSAVLCSPFARAETSAYTNEVDITALVRAAGAGTTRLIAGEIAANSIDNAFGAGMEWGDRVLLKGAGNTIQYDIGAAFATNLPITVTSYVVRRAIEGNADSKWSKNRAPSKFYLQGSMYGGDQWVTLDERKDVDWWDGGSEERTFAIDPACMRSFRHYRFVTVESRADAADTAKCSFQCVRLNGALNSEPLLLSSDRVDYLDNYGEAVSRCPTFCPTLDSKVEMVVRFSGVTGTQCLFAGNAYSAVGTHFRLFYTAADGWRYFYGEKDISSGIKANVGCWYTITVEGPVVKINGQTVIDAGETLTAAAGGELQLFTSDLAGASNKAWIWVKSVKAWDGDRNLKLDLSPILWRDGYGYLYDSVNRDFVGSGRWTERGYLGYLTNNRINITRQVGDAGKATVSLAQGTPVDGYPVGNFFDSAATKEGRGFCKKGDIIQYDIADDYSAGAAVVLTQFAFYPSVGDEPANNNLMMSTTRGPTAFTVQGATTAGGPWQDLLTVNRGIGPDSYYREYAKIADGLGQARAVSFLIPDENRGNYRHYRFVMTDSSANDYVSLQEIRLFGSIGSAPWRFDPVDYVQNKTDEQHTNLTYFKTDLQPDDVSNWAVELTGTFTRTDQTMGLFCARGKDGANPWVLWLVNGKLRLDYNGASPESGFPPVAGQRYRIRVEGNRLFVDGNPIYTAAGSGEFTPGAQIVLLASHNGETGFGNQACFKLERCTITDGLGGVVRDYIPAKRSDNAYGLFDRALGKFVSSGGTAAIGGTDVDTEFRSRGRGVTVVNADESGTLSKKVELAFSDFQYLPGTLYAAFDNSYKGESTNGWALVESLGTVKTGVDTMTVTLPKTEYARVKFFVYDALGDSGSHTKTYRLPLRGTVVIIR